MDWLFSKNPVDYDHAVREMETRAAAIRAGNADEAVWLLEHPSLYTAGTSAKENDLLHAPFPVHQTGRGGQYTYHGPGQRIAYVMVDLQKRAQGAQADIRQYVWTLEEWVIRTLADLGIVGERRKGRIGIWVAQDGVENKIAALGVRVRAGVTYHGVSINVDPDLSHYAGIVPCGIAEHGVTSVRALGNPASMADLDTALKKNFVAVF